MNFLNPGMAITGLACIAVPILIHILMRRRRRPVAWGAMQFLLAAYRQQRRRMNLEQWLLLASRCLIVALVALAVGKPVLAAIGGGEGHRARTLYVLLDNSLTSGASPGTGADELSGLKASAKAMLASLSTGMGDRAALVTLAGPARSLVMPPAPDAAQVSQALERVDASASRADLEGAVRLVRQAITDEKDTAGSETVVAVFSSFRAGSADLTKPLEALSTSSRRVSVLAMTPADSVADNMTITSVSPLRALLITGDAAGTADAPVTGGGTLPVRVELTRSGSMGTGVTQVRAWVGGLEKGVGQDKPATAVVHWNPGQRTATAFLTPDTTGGMDGAGASGGGASGAVLRVEISADAIAGDNVFVRPLESVPVLRVALIAPNISVGGTGADGGGVGSFSSQDWLALALSPQTPNPLRATDPSGIRVEVVDPTRLTGTPAGAVAPELAGAGAVVVSQPHLLDAGAWRAVASAASRGAFVMVVPPEAQPMHTWTDVMNDALGLSWKVSREAGVIGTTGDNAGLGIAPGSTLPPDDDLLALVRPEMEELVKVVRVRRALTLEASAATSASSGSLLSLADGSPLVVASRGSKGRGLVVLWLAAPSLDWTDLPTKPLMVPLMQELVRQGAGRSIGQRAVIAGGPVRVDPGATELAGIGADSAAIVRVAADGTPLEALRDAGLWRARSAEGRTLSMLAVNHDPAAGDTTPQRSEDVLRWLGGLSGDVSLLEARIGSGADEHAVKVTSQRGAPPVSLPLLIAAGVAAVVELLMARWFSHAKVGADGTGAIGGAGLTAGATKGGSVA